ncbi:hypothetical protein ACIQF6_06150 [Kitasatospora sp. NPDC092948]|uniref:hypothetical protein n=1 Tax=Kitasatospora sp. NPDC092948 TaxID=3364088 RepID=UPI0037FC1955
MAIGVLIRLPVRHEQSDDFRYFLVHWYRFIQQHGGFHALKDTGFSDYNVPYLYVLAALTYLPVSPLTGIKAVSVAFDVLQCFFVFRIVALRHPRPGAWQPFAAALLAMVLPTVATNSGWWAQSDAIYTSFVLGALWFVLRGRSWGACAMLGLALAFKLQAVFVFPFLLVMLLTRQVRWRSLLAVPAVFLALDVPALLLGADPVGLLTVYSRQTDTYPQLTLNAPSLYQFVASPTDPDRLDAVRRAGIVGAGLVVIALIALAVLSRTGRLALRGGAGRPALTPNQVLLTALCSAIAVPFLLPSMHDRYFYVADVLSLVAAFYLPRRLWFAPVLVQAASFASYLPYVRHRPDRDPEAYAWSPFGWHLIAGAMAAALAVVLVTTALEYRKGPAAAGVEPV